MRNGIVNFRIDDPGDLRQAPIVRALRGEEVPAICMLRSSGPFRKYSVAASLSGAQIPIRLGQVELGVAILELRRDGLYFTNITPTPAGVEWAKNPKIEAPPIPIALRERTP